MLIIGLSGTILSDQDRELLSAPQVSGAILFTRNFTDREQLGSLIADIRGERPGPFLLCVDQEGGRVQRFREGFTALPALARLGELHARDRLAAIARAEEHAWLMASEMRALDIDLSFAPVADLGRGNLAIGDRALAADPDVVSELVQAYLRGMRLAGMAATLKHFPGHGSVRADTHFDEAIDPRSLDEIRAADLVPFIDGIEAGAEAVMLAHVTYPAVDARPAGFSPVWVNDILRGELGFNGTVIADDIGMAAAEGAGRIAERIEAHLAAGCDLVLACAPGVAAEAVAASRGLAPCAEEQVAHLQGAVAQEWDKMVANPQYHQFAADLAALAGDAVHSA